MAFTKAAGWLDPADVAAHLQLPGAPPSEMQGYVDAAEFWIEQHLAMPTDPVAASDFYLMAKMVASDLWADRNTTGGVQAGSPDLGYIRLGDFSEHTQLLMDPYRRWAEMFA